MPPNLGSKSISALIGLSTFGVSQQFQANRQQIDSKPATNTAKTAVVRACVYVVVQQLVEGKLEMGQNCGGGTI